MTQIAARSTQPKIRPAKITYDEFLKRYMDGEHLEWVNGRVIPISPVTRAHEDKRGFLLGLLREYTLVKQLGAVSSEPYNMKIGYGLPGRSPDILFVAKANLARMHNEYLDGPADLVVEIISPESRRRDRVTKFAEYEQGGIREYWIIDPKNKTQEFFARDDSGKFQPVTPDPQGIYRSTILEGFWLDTHWLWQDPMPTLIDVLKAWNLI